MKSSQATLVRDVDSRCLDRVAWSPLDKKLYVRFTVSQMVYAYEDVTEGTARALVSAQSVGHYFIACVKGSYSWTRELRTMEEIEQRLAAEFEDAAAGGPIFWFEGAERAELFKPCD